MRSFTLHLNSLNACSIANVGLSGDNLRPSFMASTYPCYIIGTMQERLHAPALVGMLQATLARTATTAACSRCELATALWYR